MTETQVHTVHQSDVPAPSPAPAAPTRKSFGKERKAIEFDIDGDVFYAYPGMATDPLIEAAVEMDGIESQPLDQQFKVFRSILELVLRPASFQLFSQRMGDRERPIDPEQCSDVVMWLLGEYGLRPTQPFEPSSAGPSSQGPGTNSTVTLPAVEFVSEISPSTAS